MLSNQKIEMYFQIFTKNRMFSDSRNESQTPSNNAAVEIYSQGQLPRHRRGTSILRSNSKSKYNDSFSKPKK